MLRKLILFLIFILASTSLLISTSSWASDNQLGSIKEIPIQHKGRIKSFDSFANQTARFVSGKSQINKIDAHKWFFNQMLEPDIASTTSWIKIHDHSLRQALKLPKKQTLFNLEELNPHRLTIRQWAMKAKQKRDQDIRPSRVEQKSQELASKIFIVDQVLSRKIYTLIPHGQSWHSPFDSHEHEEYNFKLILDAYKNKQWVELENLVNKWLHNLSSQEIVDAKKISWEILYTQLKPFFYSGLLYFFAFIFSGMLASSIKFRYFGYGLAIAAFIFHTLGLILRVIILERPPVSNMYESMIFMNWALIIIAFIVSGVLRTTIPISVGCIIGSLVMLYTFLLPLDPSMEVLVPVLRSNYWLTVHVMTIVSSYGAFGLALALGHRHLWNTVHNKWLSNKQQQSEHLIQRIIEIGVILIGTGTVLGGVWANESWGRFWGWDPKETWALITFLGYLIVIHLKYFRKINDFYFAFSTIIGFFLVLMTWYGVNFVLGRGLHSYGQGSGGMAWVIYYLILEIIFVSYIFYKKLSSSTK